jgi:hypothetical protein
MRIKSIAVSIALVLPTFFAPMAQAAQKPVIESFTFTPNEIEITSASTKVEIELIVSHPNGIENLSTLVSLSGSRNDTLSTYLTRIDSPINRSLTKVTYRGSFTVPRDIASGVYNFSVAALKNNDSAGYQYGTDAIEPKKIRDLVGGEYGLLVKSGGNLDLSYDTFVGPTYDLTSGTSYKDSITYNSSNFPIWKVGETFVPSKFYELRVPSLSLGVTSATPLTCASDGKQLKFLKEGLCTFTVLTPKTNEYSAKLSIQSVTITAARLKPELVVDKIANQTAKDLPKLVEIFRVYSGSEGYVPPQSITPTICFGSGYYVKIISGGTCIVTYQTKESATYLASDLYKVSFEVIRDPQTITFSPTSTVDISSKSLALVATASSGGTISFSTTSTENCSISGSTLNLIKVGICVVTASQLGTTTLAPVSASATIVLTGATVTPTPVVAKKTIVCVKGKITKKVSGTNPKCPKGYKLKK